MDLNLATTIVNNNQENNELLLTAVRNKFAAKTATEAAAFSPPKFNIPVLKTPVSKGTTETTIRNQNEQNTGTSPSSELNNFLLKQLQQQHQLKGSNETQTGFVLPKLQLGNNLSSNEQENINYKLPILKKANNTPISSLTTTFNKLQVDEDLKKTNIPLKAKSLNTPAIDLTSALATKLQNHQGAISSPARSSKTASKNSYINEELDFEIPFIDCERFDISRKKTILSPISNKYCTTDVSQLRLKHTLVEPSAIGRLLNSYDNKYIEPLPPKCFSAEFQQQSVKHNIKPFRFDTKSPDDLVMDALNKYHRRYHN